MMIDQLFYAERSGLRKIALLTTVPCAILPVMMACAGWMSLPFEPMFFRGDWLLWMLIYGFYVMGLYLSWHHHRRWIPFMVFGTHALGLAVYIWNGQPEWAGYLSIIGVMAASLVNQYFRVGTVACADCFSEGATCSAGPASEVEKRDR